MSVYHYWYKYFDLLLLALLEIPESTVWFWDLDYRIDDEGNQGWERPMKEGESKDIIVDE